MSCSAQLSESIFISLILGVHVEDEKGRMILPSSKELPRMTQLPDRIVNLGNESAKFSRSVAFPSQHELYMTNVPSVCFFSCLERHRSYYVSRPLVAAGSRLQGAQTRRTIHHPFHPQACISFSAVPNLPGGFRLHSLWSSVESPHYFVHPPWKRCAALSSPGCDCEVK